MDQPPTCPEDDISVLSTSFVLNSAETNEMISRMTCRTAEISDIDEGVRSGQISVSQFWARREMLLRANFVAEALLAPVRKLPAELLGEIFTGTIPELSVHSALKPSPHPFDEGEPYPHHMRLVLRQVCRLWNIIASRTPRLWSILAVDDYHHLPDFERGIIHSKACPLDIYIGRFGWRAPFIQERLRSEVARIRLLILPSPHDDITILFPNDESTAAQSLEVLAWSWYDYNSFSPLEMGRLNINAPKLQFAALVDSPLTLKSFPKTSLRGLRRLHFLTPSNESLSSGSYLGLLVQCPSLEELEIHHISGVWDSIEYDGIKVPLLSLKVLVVIHSHDDETILFLEDLHAPKLEELSLSLNTFPQYEDEGRWPIDQGLRILLAEARKSLRKIKLEHLCLLGNDNVPLLSSLVNLQTLEIKKCIIGNAILADLTPESASSTIWPCAQLSTLILYDVKLSGDELLHLVRYRTCADIAQITPGRFTSIVIKSFHGLEDHHEDELSRLAYSRSRSLHVHPLMEDSFSSSDVGSDPDSEW